MYVHQEQLFVNCLFLLVIICHVLYVIYGAVQVFTNTVTFIVPGKRRRKLEQSPSPSPYFRANVSQVQNNASFKGLRVILHFISSVFIVRFFILIF